MNTINNVAEIQVSYYPSIINSFQINDSKSSFELLLDGWCKNTLEMQEEVKILLLNRSNKVLGIYTLAKGGLNSCEVDIRIILSVALKTLSTGIILIHNHPSGNTKPSKADISITEKLKSACVIMNIMLLDHLIITKSDYYSFADEGLL